MSLAEQQAAVLAALTGEGPLPAGFTAAHWHTAARSLAYKRHRSVVEAWPLLAPWVDAHFGDYARAVPLPCRGGPMADARFFARWLAERGLGDDTLQRQALSVDLRYAPHAEGLVPRRGPCLRLQRWRSGRWALALRLPGGRSWWFEWRGWGKASTSDDLK